jgi:hypothetical protein
MVRSFRSRPVGWRNESYRHYLAAKGVRTNRYFVSRRRIVQAKLRDPLLSSEDRAKLQQELLGLGERGPVETPRYTGLDPASKRSEGIRGALAQPTEQALQKEFRLATGSEEEYQRKKAMLDDVDDEVKRLEAELVPVSKQEQQLVSLTKLLSDRVTDEDARKILLEPRPEEGESVFSFGAVKRIDFDALRDELRDNAEEYGDLKPLLDRIDALKDELELAKVSEKRERLGSLREEKSGLRDEIDALSGVGRKVVDPAKLTVSQLQGRLSRVGYDREALEGMSREELERKVLKDAPLRLPREQILTEERPRILRRLEGLQEVGKKVQFPGATELGTVSPVGAKTVSEFKREREPVGAAVERVKASEEVRRAALERAREAARLRRVPEQLERAEKAAAEERKELEGSGELTPLKKGDDDGA